MARTYKLKKRRLEEGLYKIGEIAKETRVLPSTVRYYTDLGLLTVAGRSEGGHRLYAREETVNRIHTIQALSKGHWDLSALKDHLEKESGRIH